MQNLAWSRTHPLSRRHLYCVKVQMNAHEGLIIPRLLQKGIRVAWVYITKEPLITPFKMNGINRATALLSSGNTLTLHQKMPDTMYLNVL